MLAACLPARMSAMLISRKATLDASPSAVVGTASLRRQAMVKRRPDIAVVPFRGNVRPGRTADDGVA